MIKFRWALRPLLLLASSQPPPIVLAQSVESIHENFDIVNKTNHLSFNTKLVGDAGPEMFKLFNMVGSLKVTMSSIKVTRSWLDQKNVTKNVKQNQQLTYKEISEEDVPKTANTFGSHLIHKNKG